MEFICTCVYFVTLESNAVNSIITQIYRHDDCTCLCWSVTFIAHIFSLVFRSSLLLWATPVVVCQLSQTSWQWKSQTSTSPFAVRSMISTVLVSLSLTTCVVIIDIIVKLKLIRMPMDFNIVRCRKQAKVRCLFWKKSKEKYKWNRPMLRFVEPNAHFQKVNTIKSDLKRQNENRAKSEREETEKWLPN